MRPLLLSSIVLLASAAAYINARSCGFAFDDAFAITYNGDVTDPLKPLSALLEHDFWGQDIRGEGSHKSFRPLCVLTFRANWAQSSEAWRPWSFHVTNVALHALVSVLVYPLGLLVARAQESSHPSAHALIAALLFALHPVHTEAVTGVVGRAELLSAVFCIAGFLCYARACAAPPGLRAAALHHTPLLFAALACATAAMASKETGFMICGSFLLWEVCSFALRRSAPPQLARGCIRASATLVLAICYLILRRRVIGGDTLVHIYRKVENPLAFYGTRMQRLLSTAQLHSLYVGLLAVPLHLSADWSFACVKPVESLHDPRNVAPLLLIILLSAAFFAAQPWRLALHADGRLRAARVRLFVLLAFVLAPFLPAANIFVYVGTYIGERLLYMPSLGFCLLLAEPLARCSFSGKSSSHAARLLTCLLLLAYAARTFVRNRDWESEETLFLAALRVCPDSAKVRLNVGILSRRSQDWEGALAHFHHARKVEPSYCDPQYWIGLTQVNQGQIRKGVAMLEKALDCKWVAVEAGRVLLKITTEMLAHNKNDVRALSTRGLLLTKVEQHEEACRAFIRGAAALAAEGRDEEAAAMRARCQAGEPDGQGRSAACEEAAVELHLALAKRTEPPGKTTVEALRGLRAPIARSFLSASAGGCDSHESYLSAVNALQRAEPYDPLLHREWARLLSSRPGREAEARQHLNAAAALFYEAGLVREASEAASMLTSLTKPEHADHTEL